ncbi:MAG: type VI secretion system lipoprotein TssJ [Pseudomonadota bacterium]
MKNAFRVGLLLFILAACAPKPPSVVVPQKPRTLTVNFAGGEDLNPAMNGTPAPVQVRLFLLNDVEGFENAGYFDLLEDPETALSSALLGEEKLFVEPASDATFKGDIDAAVTHIGIVVGFRDYDDGKWRIAVPVEKRRVGGLRRDYVLEGSSITESEDK